MNDNQSVSTITESCCIGNTSLDLLACDSSNSDCLFGRSRETLTLLKNYADVIVNKNTPLSKSLAVVHGESGSGKTSLIETLRKPVSESNGFFCTGKFFQPPEKGGVSQEPYSAIMAAFSDLCDLVLQSSDYDSVRRMEIQQALGHSSNLLVNAISNLSPFLDEDNGDQATQLSHFNTTSSSARTEFRVACQRFLHAMTSNRHPIVLFIDDIQWMDDGSRQLIESLLHDVDLRNIVLIFAYREEEAESIGDLFLCDNTGIIDIVVKNLDSRYVYQLVSALLGSSSTQIRALSDLAMSKTAGNPFHVIQFIETIQNEGLLVFDKHTSMWVFDVCQINSEMMVSETLCDLLSRRIGRLDMAMQKVLKIASLIGFSFATSILINVTSSELSDIQQLIMEQPLSSYGDLVESVLSRASVEGFIERTGDSYQFSHDKLQDAFQSMADHDDKQRLHYLIGAQYVLLCQTDNDDSIFQAAVHLNKSGDYALGKECHDKLARINLDAANRCRDKSAFIDAVVFLRYGLNVLNEDADDMWTKSFDLSYELTENLAKMELIVGNLDACKQLNQELLLHSKSVEMKIIPLVLDVEVRMAGNEMSETIAAAKRALRELGIAVPHRVRIPKIMLKLRKVRRMVGGKDDEYILGLPVIQDYTLITAMKLLMHLSLYCLLQGERMLAFYSALLATELMLQKGGGLSPFIATCVTTYGIVEMGLGNINVGARLGELALKLISRIQCNDTECPMVSLNVSVLLHWKRHIHELEPVLAKAMKYGLDAGDVVYGSRCVASCFAFRVMLGENLESTEDCMRTIYSRLCEQGQTEVMRFAQPVMQYVLNLRSSTTKWSDLTMLSGEIMDESEYMRMALETNHRIMVTQALTYKSLLAYLFGNYEMAASVYEAMEHRATGQPIRYSFAAAPHHFYGAMIFFERYRSTRRLKHLRTARRHVKRLKWMASFDYPDVKSFLIWLEAEELTLKCRDATSIVAAYTKVIDTLHNEGFVQREALANERLSKVLFFLGWKSLSSQYLNRSMRLYRDECGATAKYEWLQCERNLPPDPVRIRMLTPIDEIHILGVPGLR